MRMKVYLAAGALAAMLLGGCDRVNRPQLIDKPAPEFALSDGVTSVDLAKLRGRVVVLNLWFSTCPPCLEELPSLLRMQWDLPQVQVLAVSTDQDDAAYRRFLVRNNVNLMTVRDADFKVNKLYGTEKFPETYIIDKHGVLRRKFVDAQNWTSADILAYLKKLADES